MLLSSSSASGSKHLERQTDCFSRKWNVRGCHMGNEMLILMCTFVVHNLNKSWPSHLADMYLLKMPLLRVLV